VSSHDPFEDLARYYDPLMEHVNYDRWFFITVALAELLPSPFRHLDAACGTGTLVEMLRKTGWDSAGLDLSPAMIHAARKKEGKPPVAVADLRALPCSASIDIVSCLFDSLNFLTEEQDLQLALEQLYHALQTGGILYADIITERMVTEHFEGQEWEEDNDGFSSRWRSHYDHTAGIAESHVRVNTGATSIITERVYPQEQVEAMLRKSGFDVLGMYDAETWGVPTKKTTRVDFVAVKGASPGLKRKYDKVAIQVRDWVYAQ
jgi:SAM-dependent methyltransferase